MLCIYCKIKVRLFVKIEANSRQIQSQANLVTFKLTYSVFERRSDPHNPFTWF